MCWRNRIWLFYANIKKRLRLQFLAPRTINNYRMRILLLSLFLFLFGQFGLSLNFLNLLIHFLKNLFNFLWRLHLTINIEQLAIFSPHFFKKCVFFLKALFNLNIKNMSLNFFLGVPKSPHLVSSLLKLAPDFILGKVLAEGSMLHLHGVVQPGRFLDWLDGRGYVPLLGDQVNVVFV